MSAAPTRFLPQALQLSNDENPLLSLRAASQRGWPHPNTLRGYIHEGRLPAVKVGKQFMVRESDLQRLAAPVVVNTDRTGTEATSTDSVGDLAAMAAQLVSAWPTLSTELRVELGRLLAAS